MLAIRLKCPSASSVEPAEQLIIFQTKYLDTYDQAFHTAYKQVSPDNNRPVRTSGLCACKH